MQISVHYLRFASVPSVSALLLLAILVWAFQHFFLFLASLTKIVLVLCDTF
jgi:hypothetical protein